MDKNNLTTDVISSINEQKNRLVMGCNKMQANAFISRLKRIEEICFKSHKPATDKVSQDRYSFTADIENISVVYETKADTLIITASDHILSLLKLEFEKIKNSAQKLISYNEKNSTHNPQNQLQSRTKFTSNSQLQKPQSNPQQKLQQNPQMKTNSQNQNPQMKINSQSNQQLKTNLQKSNQQLKPQSNTKKEPKNQPKPQQNVTQKTNNSVLKPSKPSKSVLNSVGTNAQVTESDEFLNGVTRFKMESMLNTFSKNKNIQFITDKNSFREGCEIYSAQTGKNKVVVKYHAQKQMAQVLGKGKLFDEVKSMLTDTPKAKVDESKLKVVQNKLKKLLPNAFDVLSEQSLIDISIGMADINNDKVSLSDYSMLLVPPYRGLERLIFDLQKAKGIDVKMIGQAYEKLDGKYVLKSGYRKRLNSHVYCEVMNALYTEYFEKRNFYTHSDIIGDAKSRVIANKNAVKTIFTNLVELIEYNVFKLKEINFFNP